MFRSQWPDSSDGRSDDAKIRVSVVQIRLRAPLFQKIEMAGFQLRSWAEPARSDMIRTGIIGGAYLPTFVFGMSARYRIGQKIGIDFRKHDAAGSKCLSVLCASNWTRGALSLAEYGAKSFVGFSLDGERI